MIEQAPEVPGKPIQPEVVSEIPPNKNYLKIILLVILGLVIVAGAVYAGITIGRKQVSPNQIISQSKTPTPTSEQIPIDNGPVVIEVSPTPEEKSGETANWKTYGNDNIVFKYPSDWEIEPLQQLGSGYAQEIKDENGIYVFTVMIRANYNNGTGKPFKDLYEYINIPYKVKEVVVDGQKAVQPLPRAGSENTFGVFFFSKDSKNIINFELNTLKDGSKLQEGQKIFDQILSTFKFLK